MLQDYVTIAKYCNMFVTVFETGVRFRKETKKSLRKFKGKRIP